MGGNGGFACDTECDQAAVDLAAGTNPLDDLLAKVATLLEMHGVHELGLLYEMGLAEVDAVAGFAVDDTGRVGLVEGDFGGSG